MISPAHLIPGRRKQAGGAEAGASAGRGGCRAPWRGSIFVQARMSASPRCVSRPWGAVRARVASSAGVPTPY